MREFIAPNLTADRNETVDVDAALPSGIVIPVNATSLIITAEHGYAITPTSAQAVALRIMPNGFDLTNLLDREKGTYRAGPGIPNIDNSIAAHVVVPIYNGVHKFFYALQSSDSGVANKTLVIDLWGYEINPSASFVQMDTRTKGNWRGVYGSDGYNVIGDGVAYPSYVTVTPSNNSIYVGANPSTDVRALQKAAPSSEHIEAFWFNENIMSVDLNFSDAASHQVALYCWDSGQNGRAQRVDVVDVPTNAVLDSWYVTDADLQNGVYLAWKLSGHVKIHFKNIGTATLQEGLLSGLFFDPA
jgi:hypothetical protein